MFAHKQFVSLALYPLLGNRISFRIPERVFIHAGIDDQLHMLD